jgi:hypothetical protein
METIRQFFINVENNVHQLLTLVFTYIHATIDTIDLMVNQWVVIEEEQDNNNRKIGFK